MIRRVAPEDIAIFFEHQDDPAAGDMAASPVRGREAHAEHWARILGEDSAMARTIVEDGLVVGNVVSFLLAGQRHLGYWIGRQYWGRGYATAAVAEYIAEVAPGPLWARVAEHNLASIRVLTKCGFVVLGEEQQPGDPIKEVVLRWDQ